MSLKKRIFWTLLFTFLGIAGFAGYYYGLIFSGRNPFLNLGEVAPGKIYRSGVLGKKDIEKMVSKYGVKTIICIKGKESPEIKQFARSSDLNLLVMKARAENPIEEKKLQLIMKVLSEQPFNRSDYSELITDWIGPDEDWVRLPGAFLIHCQMGADRTGFVVAIYRICAQGWEEKSARREMLKYFHLPPRYPKLWQYLRELNPQELCPALGFEYPPLSEAIKGEEK